MHAKNTYRLDPARALLRQFGEGHGELKALPRVNDVSISIVPINGLADHNGNVDLDKLGISLRLIVQNPIIQDTDYGCRAVVRRRVDS